MKRNLLILVLLVGYIVACATQYKPPPDQPPAVQQSPIKPDVTDTKGKVESIKPPLEAATQRAQRLTPANVETEKPSLTAELGKAWAATLAAINSAKALETKAAGLDKANAAAFERELRKDAALAKASETIQQQNAVITEQQAENDRIKRGNARNALTLGIIACFIPLVLGIVLCKFDLFWGLIVSASGAVGIGCGIMAISFNNFVQKHETEIGIGILIVAVTAIGGGLWFAYTRIRGSVKEVVTLNNVAKAVGALDMSIAGPLFDAGQSKFTKKLVDQFKPAQTKQARQPAPDIDGPGNVAVGGAV